MTKSQNSPTESNVGVELPWDHEPCPRDGCDGELQQQDDYNVMCVECEEAFVWVRGNTGHHLVDENNEKACQKRRLATDGGTEQTTTERIAEGGVNWSRPAPHPETCTCWWCEEVLRT